MDPYLEGREIWLDFHHRLISTVSNQLQPQLRPRGYFVAVESRIWIESPEHALYPDLMLLRAQPGPRSADEALGVLVADEPVRVRMETQERHEAYLQIFERSSRRLITGIEVISPSKKSKTDARAEYIKERNELRRSGVSLVEIDLLRSGRPLVALPPATTSRLPYHRGFVVNIGRAKSKHFESYPVSIRLPLPRIGLPLEPGEPDVVLDLQAALALAYEEGAYEARIDYKVPARPPLAGDDAAWADELLTAFRKTGPPR